MSSSVSVATHFARTSPSVRATYDAILVAAQALGPVREDPKKTSIHLVRTTAFAGVATRTNALVLTLKAARRISSPRVRRAEQASANRWHLEIPLSLPSEVDSEIRQWLTDAYALA